MATSPKAAATGNVNQPPHWLDLRFERTWRSTGVVTAFVILHAAMDSLGLSMAAGAPPSAITIWPSAGLVLGIFLLTRPATWIVWAAGSVAAHLLVTDVSVGSLGFAIPVPLQAAAATAAYRGYFTRRPAEQHSLRPFVVGVGLAIAVTGTFAAIPAMFQSTHYGLSASAMWRVWWAANCLGIVLTVPLVLSLCIGQRQPLLDRPARIVEAAAFMISTATIALAMLVPQSPVFFSGLSSELPLLLILPVLAWGALRFDDRMATGASFLLGTTTAIALDRSSGPFIVSMNSAGDATLTVQLFLLVVVLAALTLQLVNRETINIRSALRTRLGLEHLMLGLAARISSPAAATLDRQIEAALGELAEYAQADRAHLLQLDHDAGIFSGTHFWCRPGVEAIDYLLRERRLSEFAWELAQLRQGSVLAFSDLSRLPAEASGLRMIHDLSGREATALYYVPVLFEGQLLGAVGLSWLSKGVVWGEDLRALGQLIGQFFVNVFLRTHAEGDLLEYQQKLRALAAEMSLAEERVRRRAAVDLHDGIGQYLAVARIKLGQLLASGKPTSAAIEEIRQLVDSALKQTRYVIADLSPSVLYELGLVPALEWLAERTEPQANLHITVTEDGRPDGPDDETRVIMFQVLRELLTNVVKHAKATEVGIHVSWGSGIVHTTITDDGIGFREDRLERLSPEKGGFGLFSIRERLRAVHGEMSISAARGIGTRISVSCPLSGRAPSEPATRLPTQLSAAATRNPSSTRRIPDSGSAPPDVT